MEENGKRMKKKEDPSEVPQTCFGKRLWTVQNEISDPDEFAKAANVTALREAEKTDFSLRTKNDLEWRIQRRQTQVHHYLLISS